MAESRFRVVFAGRLAPAADPREVHTGLARLFKTEPAKIAALFTGQPVVVRKDLDENTARQYQAAMAKVGALADVLLMPGDHVEPAPTAVSTTPPALAPPPPAVARALSQPPQAPDFCVAEAGALLVEPVLVPTLSIDTAHLSVAAVGTPLTEAVVTEAPPVDLSGLSLDPPGTWLSNAPPVPDAHFDLSALALID